MLYTMLCYVMLCYIILYYIILYYIIYISLIQYHIIYYTMYFLHSGFCRSEYGTQKSRTYAACYLHPALTARRVRRRPAGAACGAEPGN